MSAKVLFGFRGRVVMRCALLIGALLCTGCTCISIPLTERDQSLKETVVSGEGRDKILLLDISGPITSKERRGSFAFQSAVSIVSRVREELEKAARDKRVKGLIVRINSPGGTVTASDIIYKEIKKFREEKKVPVIACMMELATSGGYYVAVAAESIVAHPTSITGSIGAIAVKFNAQGLMEKIGVVDETVTAGDKKDLFSPLRPATEEEKAIIQSMLDTFHERFKDLILQARPSLTREELNQLADGRVFTADQAREKKLIDEIGYLDDVVEMVKRKAGIDEARVVMYHRPRGYKNNLYSQMVSPDFESINLINIDVSGLLGDTGLHFMYLWTP